MTVPAAVLAAVKGGSFWAGRGLQSVSEVYATNLCNGTISRNPATASLFDRRRRGHRSEGSRYMLSLRVRHTKSTGWMIEYAMAVLLVKFRLRSLG